MVQEKSDRKLQKRSRYIRAAALTLVLAAATAGGLMHQFAGVKPAGVDAFCPFGGIESAWSLIANGTLLSKIAWSSFILLAAVLITAVVFRRAFCGTVCPFGALQEFFGFLGKKIFRHRFTMPAALDRVLRYLKYAVLAVFFTLSAALGTLVFRPYDPWATWQHLLSAELLTGFLIGLLVLIVSLAGSLFYDRFFCKYLCPMGAALTPFSKFGLFRIRRNDATCTRCGACDKACPTNIMVSKLETVTSPECIDCDRCVNACPVRDTLVIEGPARKRIRPTTRVVLVFGIFTAVVGVTSLTGSFEWTVRSIVERSEVVEGKVVIDAGAIKGSDTWQSIIELSGIPEKAFFDRFNITAADLSGQLKDAAHREGSAFEMEEVREFVRENMK